MYLIFHFAEANCQTAGNFQSRDETKQFYDCTQTSESPNALAVTPAGVLTSSTTTTPSHSSPPPSEKCQKPPFGCGCGNCTLLSFIERGCPTPFTSRSTFPYLNLGGLTHKQQEELKEKLQCESQQIMLQFQELVSGTVKSLIRQNVSQDELVSHVMTLRAFDVFNESQVPLFQDCLKELKAADTIPKVFMVLNNYFSFFNYDIIEHIINVLGTDEDKAELQNYKDKFAQYARRRIYECGPHFGFISETDNSKKLAYIGYQTQAIDRVPKWVIHSKSQ